MAKKEEDNVVPLTNVSAINSEIKSKFKELYRLDCDIDAATDQHIAPLKKARTKLWRDLKKNTDIHRKDLDLFYRLIKRVEDARQSEDDVDEITDNLLTVARALFPDAQLDFLTALDDAA